MRLFRCTATILTSTTALFRSSSAFRHTPKIMTASTVVATAASRSLSSSTARAVARTALEEASKDGAFVRKDAAYRNWISKGKFPTLARDLPSSTSVGQSTND